MNPPPTDTATAALLNALQALARDLGLGAVRPEVVGRSSNLAVWLAPTPWVARVTTGTALTRAGGPHRGREVQLARHLAQAGAPVMAPAPGALAGPHRLPTPAGQLQASLWQRVTVLAGAPDPRQAGRALGHCHRLLAELPAVLPTPDRVPAPHHPDAHPPDTPPPLAQTHWGAWAEVQALLQHPVVQRAAPPAQLAWARQRVDQLQADLHALSEPVQWLHGDAHLNNVLHTPTGLVWTDWEDAQRAPLAWDAAGLVAAARVLDSHTGWSEAALAAWLDVTGPLCPATLAMCIEARTLLVVVWTWALGPQDPARAPRLARRLAWLGAPAA